MTLQWRLRRLAAVGVATVILAMGCNCRARVPARSAADATAGSTRATNAVTFDRTSSRPRRRLAREASRRSRRQRCTGHWRPLTPLAGAASPMTLVDEQVCHRARRLVRCGIRAGADAQVTVPGAPPLSLLAAYADLGLQPTQHGHARRHLIGQVDGPAARTRPIRSSKRCWSPT
jgi:hypothetical protein